MLTHMVQPEEKKGFGEEGRTFGCTARCMVIIMQEKVQGKVIIQQDCNRENERKLKEDTGNGKEDSRTRM